MAPVTSTSDSSLMDESDDTSRSVTSISFRSAEAAAFFPTSLSGRGVGDQYSNTFACKREQGSSWLQPNGCTAYRKHRKHNSGAKQNNSDTESEPLGEV